MLNTSNGIKTIAGHSLPLNVVFIALNLIGLTLTTMGFHDNFVEQHFLFAGIGIGLMALSTIGLIFFKGRLMIATVARVLVGSLFIVSGLIKANDPVGFSYKLEEYFEDGALAFRIKEWFGAPGFTLEYLIQYAVGLSVIICIAEIVLGVLVLIGGKIKLVSWLLLLMMLFFTFLTWHTANCDGTMKYTDRDTYALSDPLSTLKIEESKTNKDVKIISKNNTEIVVDELRSPQCVSDCGCFGDAMKGSVGRSLTPKESLWKDIVLLYLVIWIFIAQRTITPNTIRQNWAVIPISLGLVTALCWVFGWYFPLIFTTVALLSSLWIYRAGGKLFANHYGSAIMTTVWCGIFVWYVLSYDPLKDYRPYATGSNLVANTKDGIDGKSVSMLVYKNLKNGSIREYDGASKEFVNSKIWEQEKIWKYDTMVTKEITPMRLPSITAQFNPTLPIDAVGKLEMKLKPIQEQLKTALVTGLKLKDLVSNEITQISESEYNIESYPVESYQIIDTLQVANPELSEVSIRDYILSTDEIIVVFAKNLKEMNKSVIPDLKRMMKAAEKANIPFVFVTNSDVAGINSFRKKYGFNAPTFINDETEIKAISRSNPCVMVVKKGIVKGKYPYKSIPTFDWLMLNVLKK